MFAFSSASFGEVTVDVSIRVAPPALPDYVQPECPAPGCLWMPGYWAYSDDGYYWVPGLWVAAPHPGLLWTPGYWGWGDGFYRWHEGYWGRHVGFYGGVCYGYGYTGVGFAGGYWHGGVFQYNRSVANVNVTVVHNTYNKVVVTQTARVSRVSFNGGSGGIAVQPSSVELTATRERHVAPTAFQVQHQTLAVAHRTMPAPQNHGQSGAVLAKRASTSPSGQAANVGQGNAGPSGNNGRNSQMKVRHAPQPHQKRERF
jgi:hypothetical protein